MRSEKYDAASGRMVVENVSLSTRDVDGPVYFETRNGLMKVAFPRYNQTPVDPGRDTDRRRELSRLITHDERPLVAEAAVNRMWGHFFGHGFTRQVDDLGPHSAPSHPAVLARLSEEFVRSGYDQKQLIRWICQTEAYQLTSRLNATNASDDPVAGDAPLFSHMYVKPMTAEQLYD